MTAAPSTSGAPSARPPLPTPSAAELEAVLGDLRRARGVDLRGYKPTSISRRLRLRMSEAGAATLPDYRAQLAGDPAEPDRLLGRLFICYSSFNRDPAVFRIIDRRLLPELLARPRLRIWCAGCACGEEAYSLGLLIAERGGLDPRRVRIFATDIHEPAVEQGRTGCYPEPLLSEVAPDVLARHAQPATGGRRLSRALRRAIVFARHDLVCNPPIGKIDLLLCRYTLIYFGRRLQRQVWSSLLYAVRPGGYLVLGRAEMPPVAARELLQVVSRKLRIFRRLPDPPAPRLAHAGRTRGAP